jgi:hypothetical protein
MRTDPRVQDARVTDATNRLSWMTEADHEHTAMRLMAEARLTSKDEVATRAYTGAVAHLLLADRLQRARTAGPARS